MEDIKQVILDVLVAESIIEKESPEKDFEMDLLQQSAIDSLNIVEIISMFEKKFDIEFDPEDIISANWHSVNAIINTVLKKIDAQKNIGSGTL